jgi:DNA-binding MarR family transcriptional regulator
MNQDIIKSRENYISMVTRLIAAARGSQNATDILNDNISKLFGSNRTDSRCIDIIQRFGRMSAGELANHSRLTTGALTSVIDRLEKAGIAKRVRDKKDRRKIFVELTNYTNEMLALIFEPMGDVFGCAMKGVSIDELKVISQYLEFTEQVSLHYAKTLQAHEPKENSNNKNRQKQAKIISDEIINKRSKLVKSYGQEPTEPPQSGKSII